LTKKRKNNNNGNGFKQRCFWEGLTAVSALNKEGLTDLEMLECCPTGNIRLYIAM